MLDAMDDGGPGLMSHLENGDGPHRPPRLPDHMLLDSDGPFSGHHRHHPPAPVFHHASQLPPFSSIVPFRAPPFPSPLNIFTSQALSLSQPNDFITSTPLFQPAPALALPAPLKVMEMPQSPVGGLGGETDVVSTTSQLKKYGSDCHMPAAVSTPETHPEPMMTQAEGADAPNSHPPSSESSDAGSQSPNEEMSEMNGDDISCLPAKRSIERQNLNTRMIGAGSSRKQRHPMRRFSSASSDHEAPQSTSSLPSSSMSSARESREMEDQGLVAYLLNKGRVYKCEHCRIIFDDCTLYLLHNGFHSHDAQPFRCGICRATCNDRIDFNCHLTSHINSGSQNGTLSDGGAS